MVGGEIKLEASHLATSPALALLHQAVFLLLRLEAAQVHIKYTSSTRVLSGHCTIVLPLHVRPLVEGLGAKDFAELFHGVFLLREGRSLVLTSITNATPAVEQNVQVLAFLVDNLIENTATINSGRFQRLDAIFEDPSFRCLTCIL